MSGVPIFVILAPIAIILFLCFLLWILLAIKKAGKMESLKKWDQRIRRSERVSRTPTDAVIFPRVPGQQPSHQSLRVNIPPEIILPDAWEWDPRPRIRILETASRIPDMPSDSHQETPTDAASSSRIPGQQYSQQSLRVNLPPEIILSPSQHIINQKCDRPPSYESLFPT